MKYKPPRFQFFGYATERFKENLNASHKTGPGEYVGMNRPGPKVIFERGISNKIN